MATKASIPDLLLKPLGRDATGGMSGDTPEEETPAKAGFSWDILSQDTDTPNFWAILETILAMATFWFLTWYWETLWLLWSSLIVAPLLFLRSPKSIEIGVRLFEGGFFPIRWPEDAKEREAFEKRMERRWLWIGSVVGLIVGFVAGYPLAKLYLVGHEGWAGFGRGLVFGLGMAILASAAAGAGAGAGAAAAVAGVRATTAKVAEAVSIAVAGARAGLASVVGAVATVSVSTVVAAIEKSGTSAIAGAVAGVGAALLFVVIATGSALALELSDSLIKNKKTLQSYKNQPSTTIKIIITISGALSVAIFATGGVLFAALIARFTATIQSIPDGITFMSGNLRAIAFNTAPGRIPEIVPGSGAVTYSVARKSLQQELAAGNRSVVLIFFPGTIVCFLPAWLYRFTLKSTFWLWWVLLIWGRPLRTTSLEALRADTRGSSLAWVSLALAVLAVLAALAVPFAEAWLDTAQSGVRIMAQAIFVFVDWRQFSPFQLLTLTSSLGVICLFFWSGIVLANGKVPERRDTIRNDLKLLGILDNIRFGIGLFAIFLLMVYVMLLANAHKWQLFSLSRFFKGWLTWLYGAEYAAALMR